MIIEAGEAPTEGPLPAVGTPFPPQTVETSFEKSDASDPATTVSEPPKLTLEQLQRAAQQAFDEKVKEAEENYMEQSLYVKQLQEDLKKAKKTQKEMLDYLWDVKLEGPKIPTHLPVETPTIVEASKNSEVENDTTWRDISILKVIEGIEGLGTKKKELFLEHFENLGQLVDAQAEASKAFKPFKDFLPDGFGQAIADKLDERIWELQKQHFQKLGVQWIKVAEPVKEPARVEESASETASAPIEPPKPTGIVVSADDLLADDSDEDDSDEGDNEPEDFESDDDLL